MTVLDLGLEGCHFFVQFTLFGRKTINFRLVVDTVTGKCLPDYLQAHFLGKRQLIPAGQVIINIYLLQQLIKFGVTNIQSIKLTGQLCDLLR